MTHKSSGSAPADTAIQAPQEDLLAGVLGSVGFVYAMEDLARILPFSFWLKYGTTLVYGYADDQLFNQKRNVKILGGEFEVGICHDDKNLTAQFIDAFAHFIATAIKERIRGEDELNVFSAELLGRYEEINLFYQLNTIMGAEHKLDRIFEILLERIEVVLEVDRISIMLFDEHANELVIAAARGFDLSQLEKHRISLKEGISGYVLRRGEPLLVKSLEEIPESMNVAKRDYKSESFVSVPMICHSADQDVSIGVINVTEKRDGGSFTSGDVKLMTAIASVASIAIHNNRLLERIQETNRLEKELEIAETIQLGLLPGEFPVLPDVEIAGRCRSAKNVGGDYFDFILSDDRLDLVIADVSGHNVSAALIMAVARSILRTQIRESESVSKALCRANELLFEDMNQAGFFISIFLLRYCRKTRKLSFANGGHHPVLWYRSDLRELAPLDAEGLLLGVLPEVHFEEKSVQLQTGDALIMFTDGIIEAADVHGHFFGLENLEEVALSQVPAPAQSMVDTIFDRLDDFCRSTPQKDDLTLQALKIK